MLRHVPGTPVRDTFGLGFERVYDDALDLSVLDLARCARARFVVQPLKSAVCKSSTPSPDRTAINPELFGDDAIVAALGDAKNNPRSPGESLRRLSSTHVTLQHIPLFCSQNDLWRRMLIAHAKR
jgi:hypothetical protein